MTETLSTNLLSILSDFLSNQMGLYFPPSRLADLERSIRAAASAFDFDDPEACIEWLLSSPPLTKSQIETLACQLTVGETYFFREKQAFQALESHVLPELLQSRGAEGRLRIWSAGCATGEEPYSLAILLARTIPNLADWNISILGTDINPRSLQRAREGNFTAWSFRDCPEGIVERFFRQLDDRRVEIDPAIKKIVNFSYLNLVEDIYPSLLNETNALDIVFCRNVLMYFSPEQAKRVIARLHRCLLAGGWLVVSATEASHVLFSQFTSVNFPGTILYRKDGDRARAPIFPSFPVFEQPAVVSAPPFKYEALSADGEDPSAAATGLETAGKSQEEPRLPATGDALTPYEEGRYSEALQSASELPSPPPDDAKAMAILARTLANQGQLADALEWCNKAILVEKLDPVCHYLRATILQEQGDTGEAANSLKRAIYLDNHFVLAQFALGNLQRWLGRSQDAKKQFQNALVLLKDYRQEQILPESEGITAGRLREIIEKLTLVG